MSDIKTIKMLHCTLCPYKTPSEKHVRQHILDRECPSGSTSYKVR